MLYDISLFLLKFNILFQFKYINNLLFFSCRMQTGFALGMQLGSTSFTNFPLSYLILDIYESSLFMKVILFPIFFLKGL